jgi:hypothetical protein
MEMAWVPASNTKKQDSEFVCTVFDQAEPGNEKWAE